MVNFIRIGVSSLYSYRKNEDGFALLLTLLVTMLLTVMIFEFFYEARIYLLQAEARANLSKAYYLAQSGINLKKEMLKRDLKNGNYDGLDEDWAIELLEFPVGDGTLFLKIVDEESKFNINTIVKDNGNLDEEALERARRLFGTIGLDHSTVDNIADLMTGLKERSYDLDSLSELVDVKGIEKDDLELLKRFVTTNSKGLININTASKEVILSLSDDLSPLLVDDIITYREEHPFKKKVDIRNVPGMSDNILNTFFDAIDVKSSFFTIKSRADVGGVVKDILAMVKRDGKGVKVIRWMEG